MLVLEAPTAGDLAAIVRLEQASYPADEAAPEDTIRERFHGAGAYFRAVFDCNDDDHKGSRELVAFVNATRAHAYAKDALRNHQPQGPVLCVHSVVVAPSLRRRRLATQMLRAYLDTVLQDVTVEEVVLLCKPHHAALYAGVGFALRGESKVQHGKDKWLEMGVDAAAFRRSRAVQAAGPIVLAPLDAPGEEEAGV